LEHCTEILGNKYLEHKILGIEMILLAHFGFHWVYSIDID